MASCIHDAVTVSCSSEDWDIHQVQTSAAHAVRMEFPPPGLYMGMARQNLGSWAMFFWVWKLPGSKVTNTRKNIQSLQWVFQLLPSDIDEAHFVSYSWTPSKTIHTATDCLVKCQTPQNMFVPGWNSHMGGCHGSLRTPSLGFPHGILPYQFHGTITAPVKDTITASYQFHGTITAPVKDTITASYQFHGTITAPVKDTITASHQFHGTMRNQVY